MDVPSRLRTVLLRTVAAAGLVVLGALAGAGVGLATPAHTRIAGAEATIRIRPGTDVDEFALTGVLTGRRVTDRSVLGEPLGVLVRLDLESSTFAAPDGSFNRNVLPAYIQTYSDPAELAVSVRRALAAHVLHWTLGGALAGAVIFAGYRTYRDWRRRLDAEHPGALELRRAALAYRAPERTVLHRVAWLLVVVVLAAGIGGAAAAPSQPTRIHPTPLLDGTPLAGTEVGGPFLPAFVSTESYIREYFAETNTYYAELRTRLADQLTATPLTLPSGSDVVTFGFVTDRHCNTGMDRVIVQLLQSVGVKTLVSGGDDAFSGSFSFEAACTQGLAAASHRAGISDVFVGGNHDSPTTLDAEHHQGINVLDGKVISVNGLRFIGSADPRSSRYGATIQPSAPAAQGAVVTAQGADVARAACDTSGPLIAVLHDPQAGFVSLEQGCGHVRLALDGHTHRQAGPTPQLLPDGTTGYRFTGGSSGGAPSDADIERDFASKLTVGPLQHDATVNLVSVDRRTGELVGVIVCTFSPDGTISFAGQRAS